MGEIASFVALGDSFSEGVGDLRADGSCRGWADRFAELLAASRPGTRYANLAIRGKLLSEVLDEQVPAAIGMASDLVSLAAGGNDLLRPRTDPDDLAALFETAVGRLTASGATVLTFTGFDPKAFPVLRLIRGKSAVLTMHIREIAARHGCLIADLWTMRILTDRRMWTPDRLHLTPDGHRRVALLASEVAGVPVAQDWREPLPGDAGRPRLGARPAGSDGARHAGSAGARLAGPGVGRLARPGPSANPLASSPRPALVGAAVTWAAARWNDVAWVTQHAAPYLSRRLHGVSSGDGMVPKRPELLPLTPELAPEHRCHNDAARSAAPPVPLPQRPAPASTAATTTSALSARDWDRCDNDARPGSGRDGWSGSGAGRVAARGGP
jgi:lysophospholipase L1-like esterase